MVNDPASRQTDFVSTRSRRHPKRCSRSAATTALMVLGSSSSVLLVRYNVRTAAHRLRVGANLASVAIPRPTSVAVLRRSPPPLPSPPRSHATYAARPPTSQGVRCLGSPRTSRAVRIERSGIEARLVHACLLLPLSRVGFNPTHPARCRLDSQAQRKQIKGSGPARLKFRWARRGGFE